jgi:hypothetical protein
VAAGNVDGLVAMSFDLQHISTRTLQVPLKKGKA